MRLITFLFVFFGLSISAKSQDVIKLNNPSFEDTPQPGKAPKGWYNCGHEGETPPDIQPNEVFKVEKQAFDGKTYLGMVTRDNETWEAVGQRLKEPLLAGHTYSFSMQLARSPIYVSLSRKTRNETNYTTGAKLRIWGGNNDYCEKLQLLDETERINNSRWQEYTFELKPKEDINFIALEAYYVTPTPFAYNGNMLLDNCSEIAEIATYNNGSVEKAKKEKAKLQTFAEVKAYLENYFEQIQDEPVDIFGHVDYLKIVSKFNSTIKVSGLRQFIFANTIEELTMIADALLEIDAHKTADKLNEIALIYSKSQKGETLSVEERTAFENCETPFKIVFEEEIEKTDEYMKQNLSEIIEEINNQK